MKTGLASLVAWHRARELLETAGTERALPRVLEALQRARQCAAEVEDAAWLASLVSSETDAEEAAAEQLRTALRARLNEPRAACFLGVLEQDWFLVALAARAGVGWAQVQLARHRVGAARAEWAARAAAQDEPEGLTMLAETLLRERDGDAEGTESARLLLLRAAELEDGWAQCVIQFSV